METGNNIITGLSATEQSLLESQSHQCTLYFLPARGLWPVFFFYPSGKLLMGPVELPLSAPIPEIFRLPFSNFKFITNASPVVAMPLGSALSKEEWSAWFHLCIEEGRAIEELACNPVPNSDMMLLHPKFTKDLPSAFADLPFEWTHSLVGLVSQFAEKNHPAGNPVFLHCREQKCSAVATRAGKPVLVKVFEYGSAEDFLYQVLAIYEATGLNTESDQVIFSGDISNEGSIFTACFKYIRHLHFAEFPEDIHFSEPIRKMPAHWFADLFGMLKL